MSSGLPVVSSRDAVRAFTRLGYVELKKRGKGSHIIMYSDDSPAILTIPTRRELPAGTLRSLIRHAGITVDEFRRLLDGL